MKKCGHCGEIKPLEDFSLKGGKPQWQCKSCHSAYRKAHYQANKQKYIDKAAKNKQKYRDEYYAWLNTQACVDCGNSDIRVLEFDHLRDKEFDVARMVGLITFATLAKELEKGEIVCANCHRIRTVTRAGWTKGRYSLLV